MRRSLARFGAVPTGMLALMAALVSAPPAQAQRGPVDGHASIGIDQKNKESGRKNKE